MRQAWPRPGRDGREPAATRPGDRDERRHRASPIGRQADTSSFSRTTGSVGSRRSACDNSPVGPRSCSKKARRSFQPYNKTFLFTVCVAAFDVAEGLIRGLIGGLGPMGAVDEVMSRFNYEWLSRALVIFLAFLPLFAVGELRRVLGKRVTDIFFQRGSAAEAGCDPPLKTLGKQ